MRRTDKIRTELPQKRRSPQERVQKALHAPVLPAALDVRGLDPHAIAHLYDHVLKAHMNGQKWAMRHEEPVLADVEDRNHEDLIEWAERLYGPVQRALDLDPLPDEILKAESWASKVKRFQKKGWDNLSYKEILEVVDAAAQEAFPEKTAKEMAERTTVRNFFASKLQHGPLKYKPGDTDLLPTRIKQIPKSILTAQEEEWLEYDYTKQFDLVTGVSDGVRKNYKRIMRESKQAGEGPRRLQQRLFDHHADLNSDMRRIAVTESAASAMSSFISMYPPGSILKWFAWKGACKYCEGLAEEGKEIRVVDPSDPKGQTDWQNTIYSGKTNYGRSFSARKITPEGMVPREPEELAGPACPAHPHCRCQLTLLSLPEIKPKQRRQHEERLDSFSDLIKQKRQERARKLKAAKRFKAPE